MYQPDYGFKIDNKSKLAQKLLEAISNIKYFLKVNKAVLTMFLLSELISFP